MRAACKSRAPSRRAGRLVVRNGGAQVRRPLLGERRAVAVGPAARDRDRHVLGRAVAREAHAHEPATRSWTYPFSEVVRVPRVPPKTRLDELALAWLTRLSQVVFKLMISGPLTDEAD